MPDAPDAPDALVAPDPPPVTARAGGADGATPPAPPTPDRTPGPATPVDRAPADPSSAALDEPRLRRLIAVGRTLVGQLDPDALLDRILAAAQELTGARYAALGVLDDDRRGLRRFLSRGLDPEQTRAIGHPPRGHGLLGEVIRTGAPLRIDDLSAHPRSFGVPDAHPRMTSFLGVPILVRGAPWGNLYLTERAGGPFTAADEEALVVLADWAAIAVTNAGLYDRLRERHDDLERVNAGLAATTAIARAIGTETDLDRVLDLIAKRGRALIDARTAAILLAEDEGALRVATVAGEREPLAPGDAVDRASTVAGEVLDAGRPRRVPAAALGPGATGHALLVPLVFRSRRLGVFVALDHHGSLAPFTAGEEELLLAFAASAATAVATAQTVGEQRLRDALDGAEQERRRWARELHDETLQGLAALRMQLVAARRTATEPPVAAALDALLEGTADEIRKLRTLVTELRPAALDDLGLGPAVQSLARDVAAATGLRVDVAVDLEGAGGPDGRLSPERETAVYRLAQEALTNVVKHAGARSAAVAVTHDGSAVVLTVRDDGRGVDADAIARREGFGITGMRERVRLEGGTLRIAPRPGGGTEVVARLPTAR